MPIIRELRLVCRTCGEPVSMPEPPRTEVVCAQCGAELGSVGDLAISPPPSRLRQAARRVLAWLDA